MTIYVRITLIRLVAWSMGIFLLRLNFLISSSLWTAKNFSFPPPRLAHHSGRQKNLRRSCAGSENRGRERRKQESTGVDRRMRFESVRQGSEMLRQRSIVSRGASSIKRAKRATQSYRFFPYFTSLTTKKDYTLPHSS
jgi:hypothetical protein